MKRAYIAGKVSGLPIEEVRKKFYDKAMELIGKGYRVYDPVQGMELINQKRRHARLAPLTDERDRKLIMRLCIIELLRCDEIHLLKDWEYSEGAREEVAMAKKYGITIIDETA